jgi:hypothetical protein
MSRIFDNYIMVDWSAASKPNTGNDSIWIGVFKRDVRLQLRFEYFNPPTRIAAYDKLQELLGAFSKRDDKTLLGFDFGLGFPSGTAAALKFEDMPQKAIYNYLSREIKDKPDNSNNRFSVAAMMNRIISGTAFPFWGCPPRDVLTTLQPKKTISHTDKTIAEMRICDLAAKASSSVWKLYSPGSVGSQTLTGIPYVNLLLKNVAGAKLFPFDTGLRPLDKNDLDGVNVIITEIYPSMLKTKPIDGEAKDLTQVRAIGEYFAALDDADKLGNLFGGLAKIDETQKIAIESEEGWVLGF